MAFCVAVHAMGLTAAYRWMKRQPMPAEVCYWSATWMLVRIAGWTMFVHLIQIAIWAFHYSWDGAIPDLATAFYFSAVTYTTTGYGDVVLPTEWRLVGSVEAMTGILMCGLSTGFFFSVFARVFGFGVGNVTPPTGNNR